MLRSRPHGQEHRLQARVLRPLVDALPSGTPTVGAGLALLGAGSYIHLAVAGHSLDHGGMASLGALWSMVYALGFGLFLPVEQEIARRVAARRLAGAGVVLQRGGVSAGAGLALLVLALAAAGPWLSARLFAGDAALLWAVGGGLGALALAHTTRGVLAGRGRFGAYGAQLGLDGVLRIALSVALGLAGVRSPFWFAAVLTLAPVLSVLLTLPAVRSATVAGGAAEGANRVGWVEFGRGLGLLTVATLGSQVVVNVAVIDVRVLAPADAAVAAAMLAAVVLVRFPLFLFASVQAALLPGLSAAPGREEYRRLLTRALGLVTVLGVVSGLVAVAVGPALAVALFDAPAALGADDYAWLSAGTLAYLWAQVLGQGVLALGGHRDLALAWVTGTLVLAGISALPAIDVATRVELGYALGSLAVVGLLIVPLRRQARGPAPTLRTGGGPR